MESDMHDKPNNPEAFNQAAPHRISGGQPDGPSHGDESHTGPADDPPMETDPGAVQADFKPGDRQNSGHEQLRSADSSRRSPAADGNPRPDDSDPAHSRRGFFSRCIRDLLTPVASLIERKVEPVTSAFGTDFADDASHLYSDGSHYDRYDHYSAPEVILRPPGALPEDDFVKTCSKCGLCVQACPVKCIIIDSEARVGDGFPYIVPALAPCVVCEDLACMKACPSGALKLVDKTQIRMGLAVVDHGACLRSHGEDCRLCVEACPLGATAITISEVSGRVLVKTNGCVGCGGCEHACPTDPAAVTIAPIKSDAFPNED
jgi:ferredoxin-type protein NapG